MTLRASLALFLGLVMSLAAVGSHAATLEIFHADSLAGPMRALKQAFEAANSGVTINLTSGTSKQLAERIIGGERCDVFASSSPAVIDQDLMKPAAGAPAAAWYVVFSANEMVVIAARSNPRKIERMSDLAAPGLHFARVTGEKDLATQRSVDFIGQALKYEGADPVLAKQIIDKAPADPARAIPVPAVIEAVRNGTADAGIVYLSAAVAAGDAVSVVRFPADVNMSASIRNAVTVPAAARETTAAEAFVKFLSTPEAQATLERTGQPPIAPPIVVGQPPASVR